MGFLLSRARQKGIAGHEAEVLLLHVLGKTWEQHRTWLRLQAEAEISASSATCFFHLCDLLLDDVPVAYLTGERGFYGLTLRIDNRVLDPRPDTETLVDWALDVLKCHKSARVADLGTGSGAIALAIKHQRPDIDVLAVDASADALAVAQSNATRLSLDVQFVQASWLEPLAGDTTPLISRRKGWELIVSNPPYIADGDHHLPALRHEPRQALTSGADGLDDIRIIVAGAPEHLAPNGWLLLEHGHQQAEAVQALMKTRGFADVQSRNDLAGIARCTGGRWCSGHKAG